MVLLFKWFVWSWSRVSLSVYIVCLGLVLVLDTMFSRDSKKNKHAGSGVTVPSVLLVSLSWLRRS